MYILNSLVKAIILYTKKTNSRKFQLLNKISLDFFNILFISKIKVQKTYLAYFNIKLIKQKYIYIN